MTDSSASTPSGRAPLEPLDPFISSIQPGGGYCMRIELAWGALRRALLRTFRPGYVRRMRELRQGDPSGLPFEPLDPRDLKFYRNQTDCHWAPEHDRFAWREKLPFARVGLTELLLMGGGFTALAVLAAWLYWPVAPVPGVLAFLIVWFFRDPPRQVPSEPGLVVSPADGKVVSIEMLDHDPFVGGPAVQIGIFLSIFNVHINRTPVAARVVGMTYHRGKFLNALLPASARENEQLHVRLQETAPAGRKMIVRQIAGAIARRIVCWAKPGDELDRGGQFGMIKLGSRTELVFPQEAGLEIVAKIGQKVAAGSTVMARYAADAR